MSKKVLITMILGLVILVIVETAYFLNEQEKSVNLTNLNSLDARSTVEQYLLSHKTGEKELLTLRLLDDFYEKGEDYLATHSDVFNIKTVEIQDIQEVKMGAEEIESVHKMAEDRGVFMIDEIKTFSVSYKLTPIDEEKGFLIEKSYDREETIRVIQSYGIWKIVDHGAG